MYAVVTRLKRKDGQDCYLVFEEGFDTEEEVDQRIEDLGVGSYQFTSIDLDQYRTWTEKDIFGEVKYASIFRNGAD